MFVKLAVLACTLAVALGVYHGPLAGGVPAHQFPAGVSPQACPNFPNCNNPAVAAQPNAPAPHAAAWQGNQGAWQGNQGAWNANQGAWQGNQGAWQGNQGAWQGNHGGWNGNQNALDSGAYTGDGDYHGEGLAESGAYGNVDGYDNAPAYNQAPAYAPAAPAYGQPAAVPAGVDAHSCPNYPFCH